MLARRAELKEWRHSQSIFLPLTPRVLRANIDIFFFVTEFLWSTQQISPKRKDYS